MNRVKIVVDSISTIPWKKAEELGIELVPYYVNFEDESIREGPEFNLETFYRKLRKTKTWPTTSHPTYRDIEEIFSRLRKITKEIIYLVVSPTWTETYNIAYQVKEKFKDMRIELCDIGSALGKLGLIALEANKMANEGKSMDEIIEHIFYLNKRSELFIVLDTLKYLAKGGRIGKVKALLGSTLPIKPIITTKEGVAVPAGKVLSHKQALNWIINRIKSDLKKFKASKIKCFIEDVDNKEMANLLKSKIMENFKCEEIWEVEMSPLIGTHTGPGTWGISYLII